MPIRFEPGPPLPLAGLRDNVPMKVCLVGLDNLPLLAAGYERHYIGGESVQQTLLARALLRRGVEVSMVVSDLGQVDGARWDGIRVFKAYRPGAGLPLLRFIHPRWTGLWSALVRADADIYYTSCAGMQVGLIALFCRRHNRRFVFRTASDADCEASRLLIRYARDRRLYELGLRRADAILVQTAAQAKALAGSYGLHGRVAGMLVERSPPAIVRDVDVLWIGNIRGLKRPDRILELAARMEDLAFHLAGGPVHGEETLHREISRAAATQRNVTFHGHLAYRDANDLHGRARILVNTSDVEGFPNTYLQAWIRGAPVVTLIDPDHVIEREGLGLTVKHPAEMQDAIRYLLDDPDRWQAASNRCLAFMAREFGEDRIIAAYLETFAEVMCTGESGAGLVVSRRAGHV